MKKFITISISVLFVSVSFCQIINTTYKDALDIKRRTVLLVLPTYNKIVLRDLADEDSTFVNLYKNDIDGQRVALEIAARLAWSFTDSLVIVSQKEAKTLQRKYPEKYAILKIGENTQDRIYIHSKPEPPQVSWILKNEIEYVANTRYNLNMLGITTLVIELPQKVVEVYLPKMSPSTGDFIYGVSQINMLLNKMYESSGNSLIKMHNNFKVDISQFKSKTLLLDIAETASNLNEVIEEYPNEVKLLSYYDIEQKLRSKDTNSLIITFAKIDHNRTAYTLSNVGTGKIYNCIIEPTYNYGEQNGYSIQVLYPFLKASHIRKLTK